MARTKERDHTKYWQGCRRTRTLNPRGYTAGGNGKWYITLENSLAVFLKFKIHLPYDLTIPVLGIYPKELKAYVHTEIYTDLYMNDHCSLICNRQNLEI